MAELENFRLIFKFKRGLTFSNKEIQKTERILIEKRPTIHLF